MSKVYAVISPSSYDAPGAAALGGMFQDLYHRAKYESIGPYSLGKEPFFFDTLDAAKNFLFPLDQKDQWEWRSRYRGQDAIIELEVEDGKVKDICNVQEFFGINKMSNTVMWAHVAISPPKAEALQVLEDMLKVRFVKPHHIDKTSTHPEAQLCRQLSARFDRDYGKPQVNVPPSFGEISSIIGCAAAMTMSGMALFIPEARSASLFFAALGAFSFWLGTRNGLAEEAKEDKKREYIRNHLFTSQAAHKNTVESPAARPSLG